MKSRDIVEIVNGVEPREEANVQVQNQEAAQLRDTDPTRQDNYNGRKKSTRLQSMSQYVVLVTIRHPALCKTLVMSGLVKAVTDSEKLPPPQRLTEFELLTLT